MADRMRCTKCKRTCCNNLTGYCAECRTVQCRYCEGKVIARSMSEPWHSLCRKHYLQGKPIPVKRSEVTA